MHDQYKKLINNDNKMGDCFNPFVPRRKNKQEEVFSPYERFIYLLERGPPVHCVR